MYNIHKIHAEDIPYSQSKLFDDDFYVSPFRNHTDFAFPGNKITFSELLMIIIYRKCSTSAMINGCSYEINDNTLVIVPPGQIIEQGKQEGKSVRYSVFTSLDFLYEASPSLSKYILAAARAHPVIRLTDEEMADLFDCYRFIEKQYRKTSVYKRSMLSSLLGFYMCRIQEVYDANSTSFKDSSKSRDRELSSLFLSMLTEQSPIDRRVSFYAERLNITPKYLSKVLMRTTGRSAKEWINEVTIVDICRRLYSENKSIAQIADEMGYPDSSSLIQFFKIHEGITPFEYKSKLVR